jgi:hypothetical protein
MTAPQPPQIPCLQCGSPLRPDQHYCLQCGARHGAPRVDHLREMGIHEPPVPAALGPGSRRRRARGPWAAAAVAIVAGIVFGSLSGPPTVASSASAPNRLILLESAARAVATAAPTPTATPEPTETAEPTETPDPTATAEPTETPEPTATAEPTETPEDAAPVAATTPTPTATPAPPPAIKHVWLVGVPDLATGYAAELKAQGTLLAGFKPVDANPVAEGIALLSGQPPTAQAKAGCPAPTEIGGVDATTGLAKGDGCRYPAAVLTLPGQLATAGVGWKAYVTDPARGCPAPLNAFHSLDGACTTAALDTLVTDPAQGLAWVVAADDAGLRALLAAVLASPAYADGGLVVLAAGGPGALLLSPLVHGGVTVDAETGPYALLRTVEDAFGLMHLGHAADADVAPLGDDVFPTPTPTP